MSGSPIGQSIDRVEGTLKVTGAAVYAADNPVGNLAHGYLVTSTIGSGTVTAMDTSAASAAPGVLAVYTPFNPLKLYAYGGDENDEVTPPLQSTAIGYHGQAIGLVVAETFEQARDAAALIRTTYSAQPPVTSFPGVATNVVTENEMLGPGVPSIEVAIRAAAVTVSQTYTTSIQNHNALEPHATLASWSNGTLTVYTASQGVPLVVSRLSHTLGVDPSKIVVRNPMVGGAFGSKWGNWAHTPLTAAAAKTLNRPVKTVLTREQMFTVVGHRPMSTQTVTLGAAADGTLSAINHVGTTSKSASSNFTENVTGVSGYTYAAGSIRTSHQSTTLDVPATTIMRAPGEAAGSFALESAMDELAVKLKMDPLALRQRNYATTVPGGTKPWSSKHLDACYTTGAKRFGWARRNARPGAVTDGDWLVGVGMATAAYPAGRNQASMKVRLREDGTALVSGTGSDAGTGQETALVILAAAELGIPIDRVSADLGDSTQPTSANAGGSASTTSNGTATMQAADAAVTALIQLAVQNPASPFHGMNPSDVRYANGNLTGNGITIGFGPLLTRMNVAGVDATATATKGGKPGYEYMSFGAHFGEVRVNRWTAQIRVTRWVSVIDAGTIVNPKTATSQIMGGVIMGIGQALLEQTRLEPDTGRFANGNLGSYLVPVNADVPSIDVTFLDYPDTLLSPVGSRGIGELGIVGVAAAVANAIYNATGKRIRDLPITLDKLL